MLGRNAGLDEQRQVIINHQRQGEFYLKMENPKSLGSEQQLSWK